MQASGHMALVVDWKDHVTVLGLITLEDVLTQFIQVIQDQRKHLLSIETADKYIQADTRDEIEAENLLKATLSIFPFSYIISLYGLLLLSLPLNRLLREEIPIPKN